MGIQSKKYPAKLLLFGEYTVLEGGEALAIPYHKYYGEWLFLLEGEESLYDLMPFVEYLWTCSFVEHFDLVAFAKEIEEGIEFYSSIPSGYGAGSSGALCAGVWDRYGADVTDITTLRSYFIEMESFFHGKSSGLDPMVSFLDKPIRIYNENIEVLEPVLLPKEIEVFDSNIVRSTAPLVAWYKQEAKNNPEFKKQVIEVLLPANRLAIEAFLKEDMASLKNAFKVISAFQIRYFQLLIPEELKEEWTNKMEQGAYFKLCGAGGGGFFLVFHD